MSSKGDSDSEVLGFSAGSKLITLEGAVLVFLRREIMLDWLFLHSQLEGRVGMPLTACQEVLHKKTTMNYRTCIPGVTCIMLFPTYLNMTFVKVSKCTDLKRRTW